VTTLTALVTGANTGIGKEIARQIASAGLIVYVGSRDVARGQRAVDEIGADARLLQIDVTDRASIAAAAARVQHLDILAPFRTAAHRQCLERHRILDVEQGSESAVRLPDWRNGCGLPLVEGRAERA
jgi:NADP-dependent 3-hydroxy acid dehydrogenase YdfG